MPNQPLTNRDFAFQGRTAKEYRHIFDLDSSHWDSILDCGAGPSSFTAEARQETDVIAVDPAYQAPVADLRARSKSSVERLATQFAEIEDRFVWTFYTDLDDRIAYLKQAHEQFFSDFESAPSRYVAAALPQLPFGTNSFEMVLTAHFLFMYDSWLTEEFHLKAVEEVCRVAQSEVRIYPLYSLGGIESEFVTSVITWLENEGHHVERRTVPFEFQRGANEALVISPK